MLSASQVVVTVAMVVHDDDDIIDAVVHETSGVLTGAFRYHEILIIDNGSQPALRERVKSLQQVLPNVRMLCLSRHYETESAMVAALDNAIGDYVVLMEPDGDPPALIPELIQTAAAEGYDVIIGKSKWRRQEPWHYRVLSRTFHSLARRMLEFPVRESASYFRVLSRSVVNSITRIRNKRRHLKYLNSLVGYRQKYVAYTRTFRRTRPRREPLLRSIGRACDLLISNSAIPLRAAALLGVTACGLNLAYLVYILIVTLVKRQLAEGWLSTSIVNTTMFLCVFVILTLLSEYVYRILEETRDRPLYFVDFETNSNVTTFDRSSKTTEVNVV